MPPVSSSGIILNKVSTLFHIRNGQDFVLFYYSQSDRFRFKSKSWGKCPSVIEPPEVCLLNYERPEDSCIRISTIPLSWEEAEEKCKEEGGHLFTITSSQTQASLMDPIKLNISNNEITFLPPLLMKLRTTG